MCLDPCNVLNAPPPFYIWVISLLNHEPLLQEPPPLECLTRKFKSRLFILPLSPQTAYAYKFCHVALEFGVDLSVFPIQLKEEW